MSGQPQRRTFPRSRRLHSVLDLPKWLCRQNTGWEHSVFKIVIFIGPRYPWSDLWVQVSLTKTFFADLSDVTLADDDTNPIVADNANRAIQGNVATQVTQPDRQTCNNDKDIDNIPDICHFFYTTTF